jgi:hypothetical protein
VQKALNDLIDKTLSRRKFMAGAGTATAAAFIVGCDNSSSAPPTTPTPTPAAVTDVDILNFALNLEYLEAEYYLYAATGSGLSAADAGTGAGTTIVPSTGTMVSFADKYLQQYANEIAQDELNHVRFLRAAIGAVSGATVQPRPAIDLTFFAGLATAAGVSGTFNPFTDENAFLTGAFVFEDVGVTAYLGAAPLISNKASYLGPAAGILAVEAYHAGLVRTSINAVDAGSGTLTGYTQKISAFRSMLANPSSAPTTQTTNGGIKGADDQGIDNTQKVALQGSSATYPSTTILDADNNSICFARTPQQILAIVTGTSPTTPSPHKGVFFPAGLNGNVN